jgi:hypothetical protein
LGLEHVSGRLEPLARLRQRHLWKPPNLVTQAWGPAGPPRAKCRR